MPSFLSGEANIASILDAIALLARDGGSDISHAVDLAWMLYSVADSSHIRAALGRFVRANLHAAAIHAKLMETDTEPFAAAVAAERLIR